MWETIAQFEMNPGGVLAWIGIGLIAGWLAGLATSSGGLSTVADIAIGLLGALAGGLVTDQLFAGEIGFWASLLVAFIGASLLIALAHIVPPGPAKRI